MNHNILKQSVEYVMETELVETNIRTIDTEYQIEIDPIVSIGINKPLKNTNAVVE